MYLVGSKLVALGADLLEAGRGAGLGKDANALTGREIRRSGCPPRGQEKKHLTVKKKTEQGTRSPTMDVVAPTVSQGVFAAWQIREVQEQGSGADATKMETELLGEPSADGMRRERGSRRWHSLIRNREKRKQER
eukprot:gene7864-1072_t